MVINCGIAKLAEMFNMGTWCIYATNTSIEYVNKYKYWILQLNISLTKVDVVFTVSGCN